MSIQSITKKRVAAAVAVLSVGGAGLTMSGLSDSSIQIRAGTPGQPPAATVTRVSHDAIDSTPVRLVARRVGWGRYTVERATDDAVSQWSEASSDAGPTNIAGDNRGGSTNDGASVRVPHTVIVGLPSYEGGRPPSATAPTFDPGTSPSVDPGWTTTVDLGELPSVSSPSVDPGESGTVRPPSVEAH